MKKLNLALLLAVSTQAFAQKNELVLAPGVIYYKIHSSIIPLRDFYNTGHQLAFYYQRNLKWLLVGGGVEYGKLAHAEEYDYIPRLDTTAVRRVIAGKPYWAGNIQASYRCTAKKWTLHAGPSIGYMLASVGEEYGAKNNGDVVIDGRMYYKRKGLYTGGQAGASYEVLPHMAVSAELTARYAFLKDNYPVSTLNHFRSAFSAYNRLNLYNFSLGLHYKF